MIQATSTRRQQDKRGIVVSDKMTNTVVVLVSRYKLNKKYSKRYLVTKRYYADTDGKKYNIGEEVVLRETKPLSKLKRWVVVQSLGIGKSYRPEAGEVENEVAEEVEIGETDKSETK